MKKLYFILLIFVLSTGTLSNAWGKDCPEQIDAINGGDYETIKKLIDEGCNKRSILISAVLQKKIDIVRKLIDSGLSKKEINAALGSAIKRQGDIEIIKLLVEKGADVNIVKLRKIIESYNGKAQLVKLLFENGLKLGCEKREDFWAFMSATRMKRHDILELLIKNGLDVNCRGRYGGTALLVAAKKGYPGIVKLLIENGADINIQGRGGMTALDIAANNGHKEVVELLMDIKKSELAYKAMDLTLVETTKYGDYSRVKENLAKGANINSKDGSGKTALTWAAEIEYPEIIKLLIEKGAGINASDKYGMTPLMWAANKKRLNSVKILISNGADLNIKDKNEKTTLMHAIANIVSYWGCEGKDGCDLDGLNNSEIVQALVDGGADVNARQTRSIGSALQYAIWVHDKDVLKILLKAGAKDKVNKKYGSSALSSAATSNDIEMLQILKDAGVEAKSDSGEEALRKAAESGKGESVEILLKDGVDVNAKGGYKNKTPLILAAESGFERNMYQLLGSEPQIHPRDLLRAISEGDLRIEKGHDLPKGLIVTGKLLKQANALVDNGHFRALAALLNNGADLNATDDLGETALMKAAEKGDARTVKILLEHGADVNIKSKGGNAALSYALKHNNRITADILKQAGAK